MVKIAVKEAVLKVKLAMENTESGSPWFFGEYCFVNYKNGQISFITSLHSCTYCPCVV